MTGGGVGGAEAAVLCVCMYTGSSLPVAVAFFAHCGSCRDA